VLEAKFSGLAGAASADAMRARTAQRLADSSASCIARAVPIVPGSERARGFGMHREIERLRGAGMTPSRRFVATLVSEVTHASRS